MFVKRDGPEASGAGESYPGNGAVSEARSGPGSGSAAQSDSANGAADVGRPPTSPTDTDKRASTNPAQSGSREGATSTESTAAQSRPELPTIRSKEEFDAAIAALRL